MKVEFTPAALRYAELGWAVFPLAVAGKEPAIKGGHGCKDASKDPAVIRAWGSRFPNANVGIACGAPSGIVAIDVDPRNGGYATLAALAAKGRMLPPTPREKTGNGGLHYVLRLDGAQIRNGSNKLGSGLDVKSTGGYIVAAPSCTGPSKAGRGGPYRWEVSPFETPVARMPIWMTSLLAPPPRPRPAFEPVRGSSDVEGLAAWVSRSTTGERSNRLYWAACRIGEMAARHVCSPQSAGHRLVAAALSVGLTRGEAAGTIDSGFQKSGLRFGHG